MELSIIQLTLIPLHLAVNKLQSPLGFIKLLLNHSLLLFNNLESLQQRCITVEIPGADTSNEWLEPVSDEVYNQLAE